MTSLEHTSAELAGLTTEDGMVGAPTFPLAEVDVPTFLSLEGDKLYHSYATEAGTSQPLDHLLATDEAWEDVESKELGGGWDSQVIRLVHHRFVDPKGMLDAFVRIKDGQGVLRFAQRYGVLGLCAKGHPPRPEHRGPWFYAEECIPEGWPNCPWHETVEHWLMYIGRANALLKIAAALHQSDTTLQSDWDQILAAFSGFIGGGAFAQPTLDAQRGVLSLAIDDWLRMGDISPTFSWEQHAPNIGLMGSTFGNLGIQLMFTVSKSQGLAVCDGCGQTYLREGRKPQKGRKNFCSERQCGSKASARLRKRAERAE